MNRLLTLIDCGQSYWMDNLTRRKLTDGELRRRVNEDGLRGVTTNPSIFNNAISKSDDYDPQIAEILEERKPVAAVYEALAVRDVRDACDIMRPVFDASDGVDGFVSLEVSPHCAFDTGGTMQEARRLHKAVGRLNCLIKIPATDQGLPAIEEMLYEGININVTLIFSIAQYERVAEAYLRAMERRAASGLSVRTNRSVASFFLSRIDVAVDALLSGRQARDLSGKTAVANAKLAYRAFEGKFSGPRWQTLAGQGARVQRPLWASTGTKDPSQDDLKYVTPLVGRDTVTTLPEETIRAFADHGVAVKDAVQEDAGQGERHMEALAALGIDMTGVTKKLLADGVRKFQEDYDRLLASLTEKENALAG